MIEARISHLAYAPEIAASMLQRQQAGAIIAARQRIVEGAVGMVEMALALLSDKALLTLDEERKAAMVSNLLVVLCGDRNTHRSSTPEPSTSSAAGYMAEHKAFLLRIDPRLLDAVQRCRSAPAGRRSLWDSSRSLLRNRTCRDAARLSFCLQIGDIDFRLLFALRCATV